MTPEQCRPARAAGGALRQPRVRAHLPRQVHGAAVRSGHQGPQDAKACIDQFEFPDIPCTYLVVWVRARGRRAVRRDGQARLCDAHEWVAPAPAASSLPTTASTWPWASARTPRSSACARPTTRRTRRTRPGVMARPIAPACAPPAATRAGPATAAAGRCAAPTPTDRRLPRLPQSAWRLRHQRQRRRAHEPAARAGPDGEPRQQELGYTEMKGSWFIFDSYRAHEDWCRWRAPYWHGSRVMDPKSRENYHLGFRCCKTLDAANRLACRARRGLCDRPVPSAAARHASSARDRDGAPVALIRRVAGRRCSCDQPGETDDRTFVADDDAGERGSCNTSSSDGLSVHVGDGADQAHAMAIIGIAGAPCTVLSGWIRVSAF